MVLSMKRKKILLVIACVTAFLLFCLLSVISGVQNIVQENINNQNIGQLSDKIERYVFEHDKCPFSLEELLAQSDKNTKNDLNRILHDRLSHHYEYQSRTNGFVMVVSSPDRRFAKGDRYLVEYEYTTNLSSFHSYGYTTNRSSFHSLLKINGKKATETWIGESKSTTPK